MLQEAVEVRHQVVEEEVGVQRRVEGEEAGVQHLVEGEEEEEEVEPLRVVEEEGGVQQTHLLGEVCVALDHRGEEVGEEG